MAEAVSVLVVDDSEDDRELCRRALKKALDATYQVAEADDGDVAIAAIGRAAPDCVLLDYSLPGRNGIEVLKVIRAQHPFVPILMLTGQGSETIAVSAMQQGAQNYIAKAVITSEQLHHAIQVAIAHCQMQRRLHEQRLSLEIFTRALAHDLKEPVRTIRSFMSVIGESETLSEAGKSYFGFVETAAERMSALIEAVYDFTRLDASAQPLAREDVDLAEIASAARTDLSGLIAERGAELEVAALPVLHGNGPRLRQVLQNLISNAIHHGATCPKVGVAAEESGEHWTISVFDNGPGIDEHQRARIFEPFARLSRHDGLGMGLAICKRIVEAHGGKISCEIGPWGGANFQFTIPKAEKTRSTDANDQEGGKQAEPGAEAQQQLATILVVDDNEAAIELARIMLVEQSKLECRLMSARSGGEALELLQRSAQGGERIDLMLLDINMPRMDGFEVLREIANIPDLAPLPVVMCSTSGYDKDKERAKTLGARGYLEKPPQLHQLKPIFETLPGLRMETSDDRRALLRVN